MANLDAFKKQAAEYAVDLIQPGMVIGLGTGRTATHALNAIAAKLKEGKLHNIVGVPTSNQIAANARALNIPLTTLEEHPSVDITIDGADEINPQLDVIKGGGGALLREKIVAQASKREIIVADDSKFVPALGTAWAVPVEVIPFGWTAAAQFITTIGGSPTLRQGGDGAPFRTDEGNYILDSQFGVIGDPPALAARLVSHPAIVEHGLFIGLVSDVVIVGEEGLRHLTRGA